MSRVSFPGRIVVLGFGSIGSGLLPLLLDHFDQPRVSVVTADERNVEIAQEYGIEHHVEPITRDNYEGVLEKHIHAGDFLVNLTVDVDSLELVRWCAARDVLYTDTVIEPWGGYYTDAELPVNERSNYFLRERVLAYRASLAEPGPTAVIAHGANPGLVSHLVKGALLQIAERNGLEGQPRTRDEWGRLAERLGNPRRPHRRARHAT